MLDRRLFLTWTSGILALSSAGVVARSASPDAAAASFGGAEGNLDWSVHDNVPTPLIDAGQAFAERLTRLTGGGWPLGRALSGAPTALSGSARIEIGFEADRSEQQPALALLDLVTAYGGGPQALDAWLIGLGGQAYWDRLGMEAGAKPLLLGDGGGSGFVWSRWKPPEMPLSRAEPLAGLGWRHVVPGPAGPILTRLGLPAAEPASVGDLPAAIAAGRVDLVECPDGARAVTLARAIGGIGHWWRGTIHPGRRAIAARIPLAVWEGATEADRALVEAAASEVVRWTRSIDRAHADLLTETLEQLAPVAASERAPPFAHLVRTEIERSLATAAETDPMLRAMIRVLATITHPLAAAVLETKNSTRWNGLPTA